MNMSIPITRGHLESAWDVIRSGSREDEILKPAVARFASKSSHQLDRLAEELDHGGYEPSALYQVEIVGHDHVRKLQVPPVRDRIVERALLVAVTPLVDPHLGGASYAYRPGLGVANAVAQVVALRDEGFRWVVRADIRDCFPSISKAEARAKLELLVRDPVLIGLARKFLRRSVRLPNKRYVSLRGLAQGCPLSPLLANLVLADVDDELMDAGFATVRYSDDILIATESKAESLEALTMLTNAVERKGLVLGDEDTPVMSFTQGFTFLGEDFGPRLPASEPDKFLVGPQRLVLYAGTQGSRLRMKAGRLIADNPKETEVLSVPCTHVNRIVCFGAVAVSAGLRSWAMANQVDVMFASRRGSYLGSMALGAQLDANRVMAQIDYSRGDQALDVAKGIVDAKLRKQIVLLRRFGRRDHAVVTARAVQQIREHCLLLPKATSRAELMGIEGAAANAYFAAYSQLLPSDLQFAARTRRPPRDVVNSALSLLYTILTGEVVSALRAAGLEPSIGLLHSAQGRRPSLALDLMEELRPMVVDQAVLSCVRNGALRPEHGREEPDRPGVLLTRAGRDVVLNFYERRMLTKTTGALPGFAGSLRRHVYRQAQLLQNAIVNGDPWTGMSWR